MLYFFIKYFKSILTFVNLSFSSLPLYCKYCKFIVPLSYMAKVDNPQKTLTHQNFLLI